MPPNSAVTAGAKITPVTIKALQMLEIKYGTLDAAFAAGWRWENVWNANRNCHAHWFWPPTVRADRRSGARAAHLTPHPMRVAHRNCTTITMAASRSKRAASRRSRDAKFGEEGEASERECRKIAARAWRRVHESRVLFTEQAPNITLSNK